MTRGWFGIPGVQEGERTLEEQILGLEPAFKSIKGKTVLDLGCAEGLILRHCGWLGASRMVGVELNPTMVLEARRQLDGFNARILHANLLDGLPFGVGRFDVVLALAIVHKLHSPEVLLAGFAKAARERLVIRLPFGSRGVFRTKHSQVHCNTMEVMRGAGFSLDDDLDGPRGERVHHWVRNGIHGRRTAGHEIGELAYPRAA